MRRGFFNSLTIASFQVAKEGAEWTDRSIRLTITIIVVATAISRYSARHGVEQGRILKINT